ncbi:MAG: S41 family peptidase [Anaerolineales bacterium]|nr:S41 family peptidase [Anaerolineales bacterium]
MNNKVLRVILVLFVAGVLVVGSFGGGFVTGRLLPANTIVPTLSPQVTATPGGDESLQTTFQPFWEAWSIAHQRYVDQPLDDTALMRGAIRGMMAALGDAHSAYLDPQEYKEAETSISGEYEGIGAYVDTNKDYLTVVSPIAGSPAEKADLKSGDQIIAIDGQDMTGVNPELARQKVLGPAGSTVHLTILREGIDQPLEFDIVRANIVIPSVESKMLDNGIAYVKLSIFGDNTATDLHQVLKDLMAQQPTGLILDLRNNPGGVVPTAIQVASEFIGDGVIMYEQQGDGTRTPTNALSGGLAIDIPLVVLVNEGSASASEIVAGAIQDYSRAKLVGVTTYGKGSEQNWVPLSNDQGAVLVTIARWLTPNGRTIDKIGLTPNVVVEMTEEDVTAGLDPQLNTATAFLLQMVAGIPITPQESALLPQFPHSSVELIYHPEAGTLSTPDGQIAYILDQENNRWLPYVPDEIKRSLPTDFNLYEDSMGWAIRSADGQELFIWDPVSFTWIFANMLSTPASESSTATYSLITCPLAMPPHLTIGKPARLTINLNVRSSPGIEDNWLQTLPVGTQVEVLDGAQCIPYGSGAYLWWQVSISDGTTGWLAEGSLTGKYYFIEVVK